MTSNVRPAAPGSPGGNEDGVKQRKSIPQFIGGGTKFRGIIAPDDAFLVRETKLADVLHQVVDEAIEVIDDEDAHASDFSVSGVLLESPEYN